MGTTINQLVGRPGGAYSKAELEDVLLRARRVLADCSAYCEIELDRLMALEFDPEDKDRLQQINKLIGETRKTMQTVIDIELKLGISSLDAGSGALDLENARAEILGRLARLVA